MTSVYTIFPKVQQIYNKKTNNSIETWAPGNLSWGVVTLAYILVKTHTV